MSEPKVVMATVRVADDEQHHIECRFDDGQKFVAVTVEYGFPNLAHRIAEFLSGVRHDEA
jgi:hypothetical protein